jgi:hypothetical protein
VAEGILENAIHDIHKPQEFMAALEKMDGKKNYYVYVVRWQPQQSACQIMDQMVLRILTTHRRL